ncbi:hypothetical protein T440DRAFT_275479 [Plenodomus tracheiphilus IPT5]|uniref:Uncharacterized protein n=1 Tax=Plenodomus tracheiphilus IPT5 TaxID=1408161 RepID=A0A6A7BI62_9PLEO|nr:hypothetical protein T440DRAFT_275479 [Plenodomus tracheiphilus IPT5]
MTISWTSPTTIERHGAHVQIGRSQLESQCFPPRCARPQQPLQRCRRPSLPSRGYVLQPQLLQARLCYGYRLAGRTTTSTATSDPAIPTKPGVQLRCCITTSLAIAPVISTDLYLTRSCFAGTVLLIDSGVAESPVLPRGEGRSPNGLRRRRYAHAYACTPAVPLYSAASVVDRACNRVSNWWVRRLCRGRAARKAGCLLACPSRTGISQCRCDCREARTENAYALLGLMLSVYC